jgi:DNA polymerase III epsilon subunit-like protein
MSATPSMKILILDTETNGLPKNRYAPISMTDAWPAILQLSWGIYTITGKTLTTVSTRNIGVALHPSIAWDTGAAAIHGLSEMEARHGTPAATALRELGAALRSVNAIVAHNLAFDKPVIRAAAYAEADRGAADLRDIWPADVAELCTMRATQNLLQLPSPYYGADSGKFKAPKLNELYAWLYGHVYDISGGTLHTARSDTHCLAHCIAGLLRKGFLTVTDSGLRIAATSTTGASTERADGQTGLASSHAKV